MDDKLVGTTLAEYTLVEKIGEGGMATVYKAVQESLGRAVALKILRPEITTNAGFLKRFHNEVQTVSVLKQHPNISYPYTSGETGGYNYLVMEYIEGRNVRDIIRGEGRLSVSRSLDIAVQVCEALGHAHERDITHRDVKPANIMVTRSGEVKVTDFGVARTRTSERLTVTGVIVGTPVYMSPEQAGGKRTDHRADIYAVGVLLYEMLSGEIPFKGQDLVSLVYQISAVEPTELTELVPDIPPELSRIVSKAMDKDREYRYQSIGKLKKALAAVRRQLRLSALPKRSSRQRGKPRPRKPAPPVPDMTATFESPAALSAEASPTQVIAPPLDPPPVVRPTRRADAPEKRDRSSSGRFGVAFFIVVLALCLVGGGMYGIRRYRLGVTLEEAKDNLAGGRYSLVVDRLEPMVSNGTITHRLQALLGLAHFKQGRYEKALEHLRAAVETNPGNALYHFNLAMVYDKLAARPASVKHFQKAIDLDPSVVMFYDGFCEWVMAASERYKEEPVEPYLGILAMPVDDRFGNPAGIKVMRTDPASSSARVAIKPGDVITHIEGVKITSLGNVSESLKKLVPGEALLMRVVRGNRVVYYNFMTSERPVDARKGYF